MLEECGPDLAVHLRLRQATGSRLFELASELAVTATATDGWCVVNDRLDVGLAAGAQAVQLGWTALPVDVARRVVAETSAPAPALGCSVHGRREARRAVRGGANYLLLGSIFASRTHPGARPRGAAILRACRDLGPPVVAIGGIDVGRVPVLLRAGASGCAVIRAVWEAEDPVWAAGELIRAWRAAAAAS